MSRDIPSSKVAELRSQAQSIPVSLQVGKNGVTPATLDELKGQLKRNKLVKVRLLPSSTTESGVQDQAQALADGTGATLIETRGGTAVLWKP